MMPSNKAAVFDQKWAKTVNQYYQRGALLMTRPYLDCILPLAKPDDKQDLVPCKKCCQSGTYIDYHPNGPIAVDCKECGGNGWVPK